jgi:hypothetical protein
MAQHVALYEVLFDEGIELKQPQGDLDKEFRRSGGLPCPSNR